MQLRLNLDKKMAAKKVQTPYGKMVSAFSKVCPGKNPSAEDMAASNRAIEEFRNYHERKPPPRTTEQIIEAAYANRCLKPKKAVTRKKRT